MAKPGTAAVRLLAMIPLVAVTISVPASIRTLNVGHTVTVTAEGKPPIIKITK